MLAVGVKVESITYSGGSTSASRMFLTVPPVLLVMVMVMVPLLPTGCEVFVPVSWRLTVRVAA